MSLEAFDGKIEPFQKNVNKIRNQKGQIKTAKYFRKILKNSEIQQKNKEHVQDPYSFRCIPQVHGASLDVFKYCSKIIEREINAVTDNPTIFVEDNEIVSAGNFHGQPIALTMDFLAISLSELGSISERRIFKLISGSRNLPAFLIAKPGINSGFMIPQYTCASIVSQNKQLCTPASIDTIDSSNGQEDHVSMGANAATKLYRIIEKCYTIQSIELMNAAQALEFRRPLKSSKIRATSINSKIKACDRAESGVYKEVNEHFGEGA
jgi:histidine ammonia-lyase